MPLPVYDQNEETTDVSGVRLRVRPSPELETYARERGVRLRAPKLPWIRPRSISQCRELERRIRSTARDCARIRRQARARRAVGALIGLAFFAAAPVIGWLASVA